MALKVSMKENQTKNRIVIIIVVVSALFGILGGIVGGLVARAYLLDNALDLPFFGEINVSNRDFGGPNIVFRDAKKVVIEQDAKAIETANAGKYVMAGIFERINKKSVDVDKSDSEEDASIFDPNDYYDLKKPLGEALVISSDGWVMTNFMPRNIASVKEDVIADKEILADYVLITNDRQIHVVDKVIKDPSSEFAFMHIDTSNLSVRKLVDRKDIRQGQMIVAVNWLGEANVTTIKEISYQSRNNTRFSDGIGPIIISSDDVGAEFNGSVVFNLSNDIVAVINSKGDILPISNFSSAIVSALRYGSVKRASLGLYYIELKNILNFDSKEKNTNHEKGIVIHNNDGLAIVKDSPADIAGLKPGDILLTVDNREINGILGLDDILKDYLSGDEITIKYLRNDEETEIVLRLGELE